VSDFLDYDIKFWEGLKIDEDIDIFIILDSANLERLWDLYENNKDLLKKDKIINIDHHISNNKFWTINIVDWNSPATTQLLYKILNFWDKKTITDWILWIDKNIATFLYMWLLTDTNNFTIPLVDEETFKIASELIKKWADKKIIIEQIFQNKTIWELKLQWLVLDRIKKLEKNNIITYFSYYYDDDLDDLWLDAKDNWIWRSLVSILNQIRWADFVSLWKIKEKETSISFRSKKYDVNKIANKLWWGWHKNAAWAKINWKMDLNDIDEKIIWLLD